MVIRLYDSRTRVIGVFVPVRAGRVSMYVCGPTVQSAPHIGHLRSALIYDLWRRWFTHRGYDVTFIRNVTDIDDKVLALATEREPWWARAYRIETEFTRLNTAMGILPPTYEPRTSGHIPQSQLLIKRLVERGHAYVAADGSGDVYFDVGSWPDYGSLTRQEPDSGFGFGMDESPSTAKRDARDFALWKGAKTDEPDSASWPSPWGPGRPGWHIQCSAMSRRYLGPVFDIHGGGLDLRFPHHENELAQSVAAGDQFARYWVHNGLVTTNGQKMSKSLDNSIFADDVLRLVDPATLRYYLLSAHYRSTLDFHQQALTDAEAALTRVTAFLRRARQPLGGVPVADRLPESFANALDDDLNAPAALAVLHDHVRTGNIALGNGDLAAAAAEHRSVSTMLSVLGIAGDVLAATTDDSTETTIAALVDTMLTHRRRAREARDFAAADRIRDELAAAGIVIDDTVAGTQWRRT
jgi:cysteinyl-tRNA synthetase